jgi:hypothetical protein
VTRLPFERPAEARDAALAMGPWCWSMHAVGAPEMAVGVAPAVTLRGGTVSLWALTSGKVPPALHVAAIGVEAGASWDAAVLALPRSLPVLWRDLRELARQPPAPVHLASHLVEAGIERRERVVDGRSFGLAYLLQLASRVLSLPLPPDVIASVAIDELGRTARVDGLFEKLDGIASLAPRISRVLVAASQHDDVRSSGGRLQLLPVRTAAQALEIVFGDALGARLAEAGSDDPRRRELVDAFFRLALVGRGAAVDWSPVERGARIALQTWPPAFDDRYRLQFAAGVAARHERNAGEIAVPGPAWLDAQPAPIRVGVLTHLVQQCADTGTPAVDQIEAYATSQVPKDLGSAFVPQLQLAGALARLWAVTGRAGDALDMQQRVARAFVAAFEDTQVSFQLSEWFRLAGALGDAEAFARGEAFLAKLEATGGLTPSGAPYVNLAQARARVELGQSDAATRDRLDTLSRDLRVPAHVRWSACRWAARAWRQVGEAALAGERLVAMELERAKAPHAARYLLLAEFDAAQDARGTAVAFLDRLAALDPGPLTHLRAAHESDADIVRFYPY